MHVRKLAIVQNRESQIDAPLYARISAKFDIDIRVYYTDVKEIKTRPIDNEIGQAPVWDNLNSNDYPRVFETKVSRIVSEIIGGFDDRYRIAADYLSILQLFSQPDFKAVYLPEVLVTMRMGGISNRSLKAITLKTLEDWRALRQTRIGAFGGLGALLWKNLSKLGQFR